jgi:hypothetical protein
MPSFTTYYRMIYRTFGYPLTPRTALWREILGGAEKRLGIKIPAALRTYYLLTGRERRFSTCHNRFLAPQDWSIDNHRLIFMEENQRVLWWGVSIRNPDSDDPPISQGINDEPIQWFREHRKCSVFIAVMLHYQAVSGGLRFCGSADAPDESSYRFEEHGWTYFGEVNSLMAYSRANQVVCLMPVNLPYMSKIVVLAGGRTESDLNTISEEIGLAFT